MKTQEEMKKMFEQLKRAIPDPAENWANNLTNSLIQNNVLKSIPFVSIGLAGLFMVLDIKHDRYLENLMAFSKETSSISPDRIKKFMQSFKSENDYRKAGNDLFMQIVELERPQKAALMGKIYRSRVSGDIDAFVYNRLLYITKNVYYEYLSYLKAFSEHSSITGTNQYGIDKEIIEHLYIVGLISENGSDGGDAHGNSGTVYILNKFGNAMARFI